MTSPFALGLLLLCLTLLPGCASVPPSSVPTLIVTGCPPVTRCQLPATAPTTNGALHLALERTEAAWAMCAAQVDMIVACQ
ncbi:Rz1-like lysis system protein LysC [Glaciimonas sp. CA11.2]|uniref:Rz1-like lysis system protein LysC n=1 Tax=Glaciimonas sp. CA11.2 TaxID=3048601 RepID=UPI002AB5C686|nr:Rz1-like lysis system protein LysC [Glaciimonas sp. CA11.2]MDY7547275.1 Rz1-like lysis system protein LysC [Glaciimonas sp. CA11.2]